MIPLKKFFAKTLEFISIKVGPKAVPQSLKWQTIPLGIFPSGGTKNWKLTNISY